MQYGLAVSDNHYFDQNPKSASNRQKVEVELGGRTISVFTDSGVFSSQGVDKGTQILLNLSEFVAPEGKIMDLGSGWGAISIHLALVNPALQIVAVEVNSRAVDLLNSNTRELGLSAVTTRVLDEIEPNSIDQIWSNPPIRIGKNALHELLIDAFSKLKPKGEAFLVVQKHLGADSLAKWMEQEQGHGVEKIENSKGFRVFKVTKR